MTSGDVDCDGKQDVVLAGPSTTAEIATGVGVLLGNGDGTFRQISPVGDSTALFPQAMVRSDIRSSGQLDLVMAAIEETSSTQTVDVAVYQNAGGGQFEPPTLFPNTGAVVPLSIAVGDMDDDGRPDIALMELNTPDSQILFLQNQSLPATFTNANAASYQTGSLANGSIVAAFAGGLATATASAPGLPLPLSLGGLSVNVTDAAGATRAAPLFYVSPKQVNYEIPDGTATGPATVIIPTSVGSVSVMQLVDPTAGGIFNVPGANGKTIAAADVYTYNGSPAPLVSSTVTTNA